MFHMCDSMILDKRLLSRIDWTEHLCLISMYSVVAKYYMRTLIGTDSEEFRSRYDRMTWNTHAEYSNYFNVN